MAATKLGDTILEREFESEDADNNLVFITFRLGIPYKSQDAQGAARWRCAYQITGIGSETVRFAMGMDAIDAMLMCLRFADNTLKTVQKDTKITWLGNDNLGLISPLSYEEDKSLTFDRRANEQASNKLFPSEDEYSPFKDILDEFFRNSRRSRNASKPDDQTE